MGWAAHRIGGGQGTAQFHDGKVQPSARGGKPAFVIESEAQKIQREADRAIEGGKVAHRSFLPGVDQFKRLLYGIHVLGFEEGRFILQKQVEALAALVLGFRRREPDMTRNLIAQYAHAARVSKQRLASRGVVAAAHEMRLEHEAVDNGGSDAQRIEQQAQVFMRHGGKVAVLIRESEGSGVSHGSNPNSVTVDAAELAAFGFRSAAGAAELEGETANLEGPARDGALVEGETSIGLEACEGHLEPVKNVYCDFDNHSVLAFLSSAT